MGEVEALARMILELSRKLKVFCVEEIQGAEDLTL
jgi:hypothetical protein